MAVNVALVLHRLLIFLDSRVHLFPVDFSDVNALHDFSYRMLNILSWPNMGIIVLAAL